MCCDIAPVTYFGLRDYGTATWDGGDVGCDHLASNYDRGVLVDASERTDGGGASAATAEKRRTPYKQACGKCGARRVDRQLGLEASPDLYVQSLVGVGREVWRVLKDDGVLWLNLGDSYAANYGRGNPEKNGGDLEDARWRRGPDKRSVGCKPKDLLGIPWRVAFALQADGWYLRSDIIWSKPNPMPESVTDRPTKAHEYLFLLTKQERYFYDASAIYERYAESTLQEIEDGYEGDALKDYEAAGVQNPSDTKRNIIESIRRRREPTRGLGYGAARGNEALGNTPDRDGNFPPRKSAHMEGTPRNDGDRWRTVDGGVAARGFGRNKRSVWTIPTMPYAGAHFATMPEALVEPCILAGSRLGDLILDPFSGSGTVLAVAERTGRRSVGVDLNPAYHQLAKVRTAQRGLRFGEIPA